jgi:hypothetical protein
MVWQDIKSAPRDRTIRVRRMHAGAAVFEGVAAWRTVHFPAMPPDPMTGEVYADAEDATGWMYPDRDKRVPEPTHWQPLPSPPDINEPGT